MTGETSAYRATFRPVATVRPFGRPPIFITASERPSAVDSDPLYWGALTLFGVVAVAQGLSEVTADPGAVRIG